MNGSRHSVGMAVLTRIAENLGALDSWRSDRQVSGEVIVTEHQDVQLVLLRPKLLMNVNGVSVAKAGTRHIVLGHVMAVQIHKTLHIFICILRHVNMLIDCVSFFPPASKFSIQPEHILLIHDELDKPLGKFGIKHGGSAR